MILYRPVGAMELARIRESGFTRFPPRLPEQPIFYPVCTQRYAEEIASHWNTADRASGYRGYVLRFAVDDHFMAGYAVQTVGAAHHREYWIPAEELEAFNRALQGPIEVIGEYPPAN